jgi:predicted Zn finger-like uncharacterized protein
VAISIDAEGCFFMAFAVVCKSCQARFLLNDDLLRRRVAGKVVTVRCRQCHAAIEVDASDVDPKSLPPHKVEPPSQELDAPEPVKPVTPVKTMTFKPAPAPPRPVKSQTLMGIGGPPRPAGATELVALSPGFLSVSGNAAAAPARATLHGFPEPPPPPGAVEELNSGDWEIPESKPQATSPNADVAPESLDDFVEELPPSLPAPALTGEEEMPSSTGTPSLKALAHHDEHAPKPRADDFFANMSAAMNGGIMPAPGGAPTIDVSALAAEVTPTTSAVEVPDFDVPLGNAKATLPLFALGSDTSSLLTAPAAPTAPGPAAPATKPLRPSPADGSLSPSTVDHPAPSSQRPDSERTRERKNVVAPATKSVPPPGPAQRRSGLAAPVLLALAATAGFLIWKRSATTQAPPLAAEPAPAVAAADTAPEPVVAAPPAAVAPAPEPAAPVASIAAAPADDVSFTTTPSKTVAPTAAAHEKPTGEGATSTPAAAKPAEPAAPAVAATPKPEPATPAVKEEPKPAPAEPAPPAEPAGPFDRAAAAAALTAASGQASACRKDGDPSGVASVVITFAPSGRVTSANVSGPPFAGTPTGGCIAAALRKAKVPAFDGDRVTVSKTIVIQ